jgi:rubrerythrin
MPEGGNIGRLRSLTTIEQVLEVASEFERTARDFYTALAPRVGKNIRYVVEQLAAEEQQHYDLFAGLMQRADVVASMRTEIERPASDRKFSDCVHLPDLGDEPDDQAVLQYALMREHAAMEQYGALAASAPAGALQDVFRFLANEETKHKNELEALYYQIVHSGGV